MDTPNAVWIDEEAPTPPPAPPNDFPRLTILHLMAWTVATAVAFLPYQVQRESLKQSSAEVNQLMQSVMMAVFMVGYGVMSGVYLFVAAATIYWKRRGVTAPLQPGHWLAFEGAISWMLSMAMWITIALTSDASSRGYMWTSLLRLAFGLVLLVWFLRLAIKSKESAAWRWMYVIVAVTPLGQLLLPVLYALFFRFGPGGGQVAAMMLSQGLLAALGAALLVLAMFGDWRRKIHRHWSHWIVAAAAFVGSLVLLAYYVWYALNSPI